MVPGPGQGFWARDALLQDVRDRLHLGVGFAIATLNLDHAVKLRERADFVEAYAHQTHVTADGQPVVWVERLAGQPVELVTGSDLVVPLARVAAETGAAIALVGTTEDALAKASAHLKQAIPGLDIAVAVSPPQGFDPASDAAGALIRTLAESRAQLCFLALGAPKQELFAARLRQDAPHLGIASIGAGLDFLAGAQRRAPHLLRAISLEWLWRLSGNPQRLGPRYVRCAALLPSMSLRALRARLAYDTADSEAAR
ncbi:MAG: WecB/TagA/CpsF family glycosyltransferase [Pseudomonadota bacterium]